MANAESTTAGDITEAAKATGEVTPTIDSASTNSITNAGETVNGKDLPKNKGRLKTVAEKFAEDHKTENGGRSYSINPEGMTRDVIKEVPLILEHPIVVMKSRTVPDRITMFGEINDKNGVSVLAILEINPKNNGGEALDINFVKNAYGKDKGFAGFMERNEYLYLDPDKKEPIHGCVVLGSNCPQMQPSMVLLVLYHMPMGMSIFRACRGKSRL